MNQFENLTIGKIAKLTEEYIMENEHPTMEEQLKRFGDEKRNS
ncbi:hypothetical protein LCGC14_0632490 [marine sediment metagenome]|uniref:Uncharacterized protein n=1 Tax=marine sediment metagenome TaxID=412755 RepID=A0A0F9R6Q3_9ZZZZ